VSAAVKYTAARPTSRGGRIDPRTRALPRRFLVTGRAVDLPRQEQSGQAPRLQGGIEFARIHVVVLDGIAGPDDAGVLEPRDGRDQGELNLFPQRRRDAVWIDGRIVEPFRLEKNLMPVALAEAHDLVLDRGAIARPF